MLILAAAAVGAYRLGDALQHSLFTYQSPLTAVQIAPGSPMPPQTQRLVLVVIGGLSRATMDSVDMPNLETLLEAGASAPLFSRPPTYSLSAWTTLLSGVWPDLNSAPVLDAGKISPRPLVLDHLLATANDAGLKTAIAASEGWRTLLPADTIQASFFAADEEVVADGQVAEAALIFISDPQYQLILVYFNQIDDAGRTEGVDSVAYASAAQQVDRHLRQILRLVDKRTSVLLVTADHGLTEEGRQGGGEPELTELPFAMIGQDVIPGSYSPVNQVDVAPTVAALLGVRLPAASQGRPLYEMVKLDDETLTRGQLQVAAQKVGLGNAYLLAIGQNGLSQAIYQDLESAQQEILDGNQAGGLELAKLVADQASAEMADARSARIAGERLPRLGLVAFCLLVALIFFWGRRGPNSAMSLFSAAVGLAAYYVLYRTGGYTLSLSSIGAAYVFLADLFRNVAIGLAAGGLLLLLGLLQSDERSWSAAITAGYDYGLFLVALAALPALFGYWQHGATVRWNLPELRWVVLHVVALAQVGVVAVLTIPLPWLIALISWGVGRWRTYSESRVEEWDPIARLRRR
jgi:hypothetical protein